jgi:dienelactone hydrolase
VRHEPDAEIPVERIDGPILLACGERDSVWAACPMSRAIVERLERHGHAPPVELLAYDDLGHTVTTPPHSLLADPAGGDDAWRRALAFLDETS